jgi:hypothetical protein
VSFVHSKEDASSLFYENEIKIHSKKEGISIHFDVTWRTYYNLRGTISFDLAITTLSITRLRHGLGGLGVLVSKANPTIVKMATNVLHISTQLHCPATLD